MGYLQALQILVRAYKAARGVMPKGLDLLKLKMKARQKAIDSKKVIEFPKERITNPFKPRPRSESEAQMLARMKRENKEAAQRLRDKKEKDLGDKLKDLPDDIPDMAEGGVASAIKKIKKRFGKKSITTGDKIKRPGNRQLFDDFKKRNKFIVGGSVRRNVTPQPRDPKLQNLIDVYESNPTLQSSMSVDDYLMQAYRPTTPTTEELATGITTQATQPAAINPIKPIIPIPESDGGGSPPPGGGISRGISLDYGYTGPDGTFNLDDIGEGTIADEDYTLGMRASDAYSGIMSSPLVKFNPMNPMFMFNVGKAGLEKAREFAEKVREEKVREAELAAALQRAQQEINRMGYQDYGSGGADTFDTSNIDDAGNYQDDLDPGQTE